jgi:hypothetical protein
MIFSASAISTTIKKVSLTTAGIASAIALGTTGANALTLGGTTTIDTTVGVGAEGSSTVTGVFSGSDTIVLNAAGTIDNFSPFGETYVTNAAGITTAESTFGPGLRSNISPSFFDIGSLLIGNDTIGFQQVFASDAANGFESPTPPETLSRTTTLATIFGSGFTTASSLEFKIEPYSGGLDATVSGLPSVRSFASVPAPVSVPSFASVPNVYTLTGSISQAGATSVPEPFTIVGTLIGGTAALRLRKKLKADHK